jgi:hypothetical protein
MLRRDRIAFPARPPALEFCCRQLNARAISATSPGRADSPPAVSHLGALFIAKLLNLLVPLPSPRSACCCCCCGDNVKSAVSPHLEPLKPPLCLQTAAHSPANCLFILHSGHSAVPQYTEAVLVIHGCSRSRCCFYSSYFNC